jgi:predicted GIY-YIG superfamily endonuclease
MGVEFIGLTPDRQQRLQTHLEKIDPRIATNFKKV